MIFSAICLAVVLIRFAFRGMMPWRPLSVSSFCIAGVLIFIGLGVEFDPYPNPWLGALIVIIFYLFLVFGELVAHYLRFDTQGFSVVGDSILRSSIISGALTVFFVVYSLAPLVGVLLSGSSLSERVAATWMSDGVEERSTRLVSYALFSSSSGILALASGIQRQLIGFWYLSVGVASVLWRRMGLPLLAVYVLGSFLTSTGTRSGMMIAFGLFLSVWMLTRQRHRFSTYLALLFCGIFAVLALDALVNGRQGIVATGSLLERVERSLRTDFAYGGLGLRFATSARSASVESAGDYLVRLISGPIPRALWPDKSIMDPNWEMTEYYWGASLASVGSISLFTPLGESIFYFGYVGLAFIPFLYGFVAHWLERIYSTSPAYRGLLAQVWVWSFLGMRHTFWNLYFALVVANAVMIVVLFAAKALRFGYRAASLAPSERVHRS